MPVCDHIALKVLTPEKVISDCLVSRVEVPGTKGRFVILKDHAPLISSLSAGEVSYCSGGEVWKICIRSGFVEVNDNVVTVCAEV